MPLDIEPFRTKDLPRLAALARESPDTGLVHFATEFLVAPEEADHVLGAEAQTFVAWVDGVMAGSAKVTFDVVQYEGSLRPAALLGNLMVHPDFRRRGIATALGACRIDAAVERFGRDALLLADIQDGNEASHRTAARWRTALTRPFVAATAPVRQRAVGRAGGWSVRPATPDDLEEVAEALATFYGAANFNRPQDASSLLAWLGDRPDSLRQYLIAVQTDGRIAAGLGLTHSYRHAAYSVVAIPAWVRALNLVFRELPKGGVVRQAIVDLIFHRPDELDAARYLWYAAQHHEWAREANTFLLAVDPDGPVGPLANSLRFRSGVQLQAAIRADVSPTPSRPLAPWM